MDPKSKERGRRKVEAGVSKRIFYIFTTFLIFWLPYPVIFICITEFDITFGKDPKSAHEWEFCAHILTTLSASINPITYALPNKQFTTTLKRTFKSLRKSNYIK